MERDMQTFSRREIKSFRRMDAKAPSDGAAPRGVALPSRGLLRGIPRYVDGEEETAGAGHSDGAPRKTAAGRRTRGRARRAAAAAAPRRSTSRTRRGAAPQKPKKPLSGFLLFSREMRPKVRADDPGISFADMSKRLGELWRGLSEEEKASYSRK